MEERLRILEARKGALSGSNQELERQIKERNADWSSRAMADARVRGWELMLGLSETQKQSFLDLCTTWAKEDAAQPPGRDTWLSRESDVRGRLSVEQAGKLHDVAVEQCRQLWGHIGRSIGWMAGAGKEESVRFQQLLGDFRAPGTMLLPEAYGADWPGLFQEASNRLLPVLSTDQVAKLNRFAPK